ncbi:hepcidin-1 [Aplochiton taeniatus]
MKAFSIAVAVTLVLAFACILGSSAVPFPEVQVHEEVGDQDTPVLFHEEAASSSMQLPLLFRQKRHTSHLSLCRYCCKCCRNKGCGFCCRY